MIKKISFALVINVIFLFIFTATASADYQCGETFTVGFGNIPDGSCQCGAAGNQFTSMGGSNGKLCCGFVQNNYCRVYEEPDQYGCGESFTSSTVPAGAQCNCDGGNWNAYWQWKGVNRGVCCGYVKEGTISDQCLREPESATTAFCGETFDPDAKSCICGGGGGTVAMDNGQTCCGWVINGQCNSTDVAISEVEVSNETLNALNPLNIGGSTATNDLSTPGGIISRALTGFIFPIAGIILFAQLLFGGFQMLTGATSKGMEEGKGKITAAIIGFIILFAAYWIAQLLELIFGIRILS